MNRSWRGRALVRRWRNLSHAISKSESRIESREAKGLPPMKTRHTMIGVAVVALVLGAICGLHELNRRADRFLNETNSHRRMEEELEAKAAYWEALASNPSMDKDLPLFLFKSGKWSRGQASRPNSRSCIRPPAQDGDSWLARPKGLRQSRLRCTGVRLSIMHGRRSDTSA